MDNGTERREPGTGSQVTQWKPSSTAEDREARLLFSQIIGPCLALVAPTGMGEEDRTIWLGAAFKALSHLPEDLLRDGAEEAMRKADHPSKIVAAIEKVVGERYANRRASADRAARHAEELRLQAEANRQLMLPADVLPKLTTQEILDATWPNHRKYERGYREGGLNLDPDRECRAPTADDYKRLFGIDITG